MAKKLTDKQLAFIEHYLTHWNATKAAIDAGYSEKTARTTGSENLTKPDIQAAIQQRLAELKMGADEVLARLTAHARGSAEDFVTVYQSPMTDIAGDPVIDQDGKSIVRHFPSLDLEKARARGMLHLVKKVTYTAHGPSVELYDAQAALALLGKHHGLLIDRQEISGPKGGPIEIDDARDTLADKLTRRLESSDSDAGTGGDSGA
jgi:phage terminase small subunit